MQRYFPNEILTGQINATYFINDATPNNLIVVAKKNISNPEQEVTHTTIKMIARNIGNKTKLFNVGNEAITLIDDPPSKNGGSVSLTASS